MDWVIEGGCNWRSAEEPQSKQVGNSPAQARPHSEAALADQTVDRTSTLPNDINYKMNGNEGWKRKYGRCSVWAVEVRVVNRKNNIYVSGYIIVYILLYTTHTIHKEHSNDVRRSQRRFRCPFNDAEKHFFHNGFSAGKILFCQCLWTVARVPSFYWRTHELNCTRCDHRWKNNNMMDETKRKK